MSIKLLVLGNVYESRIFPLLLLFCLQAGSMDVCADSAGAIAPPGRGPVLNLDYSRGATNDVSMADLMYFVALISPVPVTLYQSPTNTLRINATSVRREDRKEKPDCFSVTLNFDVIGSGFMHYSIDHTPELRHRRDYLASGKVIQRQLDYIRYEGPAKGSLDVEGKVEGQERIVSTVRLRLRGMDESSPIAIGLRDVRLAGDQLKYENEIVASVNMLEFKRSDKSPRMGVDVGSIKRKDVGNSFFQNFKGRIVGAVANMLIGSVAVEKAGNDAMLGFGQALLNRMPGFEFPYAKNLKLAPVPGF